MADVTSRPFMWADIPRVHELISCVWSERAALSSLHVGDFYWALRPRPRFEPQRDFRLFHLRDELVAFAWYDEPDSGDVVVRPGAAPALAIDAVSWIETRHADDGGTGPLAIPVIDGDGTRTSWLVQSGYTRGHEESLRFHQSLEKAPAPVQLPDGFTIHSVSSDDDVVRRVHAQRTSFQNSSATVDVWRALMLLPAYDSQLDLVAVDGEGTGAAGLTCWYDAGNRSAEFEPVGTSRPYWRMGIGKALMNEGLRRLTALGAERAIVQTNVTNHAAIAL
jgi:ribosomal protein S18 acetylase RimI-like enzyme